jgi:hypothetical protein
MQKPAEGYQNGWVIIDQENDEFCCGGEHGGAQFFLFLPPNR